MDFLSKFSSCFKSTPLLRRINDDTIDTLYTLSLHTFFLSKLSSFLYKCITNDLIKKLANISVKPLSHGIHKFEICGQYYQKNVVNHFFNFKNFQLRWFTCKLQERRVVDVYAKPDSIIWLTCDSFHLLLFLHSLVVQQFQSLLCNTYLISI